MNCDVQNNFGKQRQQSQRLDEGCKNQFFHETLA